ncbi:hypothetical protein [Sporosarcina cyprini]|uniref:hypothetical protein n=1 Tax=Sporosarcina cyprini TaxID=2910523 RepID=UPI001EDD7069|nr:hypothetical protein [Sporosarcina cyprini]MCG3090143.1 hypothetical protein [Sporosarcina cyprini]
MLVPTLPQDAASLVGQRLSRLSGPLRFRDIQLRRLAPRGHKPAWLHVQSSDIPPIRLMLVGADRGASALETSSCGA